MFGMLSAVAICFDLSALLRVPLRAPGLLSAVWPLLAAMAPLGLFTQRALGGSVSAAEVDPAPLPLHALELLAQQVMVDRGCPSVVLDVTPNPSGDLQMRRAALAEALQTCLLRTGGETTDQLRRIQSELADDLTLLQARVGKFAQQLPQLEATRFSPTTRLRGLSRWYVGGLSYYGNQIGPANTYRPGGQAQPLPLQDAVTLTYDLQLNLDTSFSGKDLLRARLRAGDGAFSGLRGNLVTPMVRLDGVSPFCSVRDQLQGNCRNNILLLDKLFYRTPLGSGFTLTVGPRLTQKDMLGLWPALYGSSERILSAFDYAGAVGAYSDVKGAGLGFNWRQPGRKRNSWVVSAVYAAAGANDGDPSQGGLLSNASRGAATLQLGYVGPNWSVAGVYTYNQAGARQDEIITPLAGDTWPAWRQGLNGSVNAFGLSGYWDPTSGADWVPAISLGWGFNQNVYNVSGPNAASAPLAAQSQSWMLALEWKDVLDDGNNLGLAVGQPKVLTSFTNNSGQSGAFDSSWLFEAWYRIQVSDALALTPALFWLPRPRGQLTEAGTTWSDAVLPTGSGATLGVLGVVLKATFRF